MLQGEIFWATLPAPVGSGPGFTRPVVVIQGDGLNASRIATVIVVPLTSNLRRAAAPGNVVLSASRTGLETDSVANVSLIASIDRGLLIEQIGRVSHQELLSILDGVDIVLGRPRTRAQ